MPTIPNLTAPIRTAIIGSADITTLLDSYRGSYPVFTRVPPPNDTPFPFIMVAENTNLTHNDGINDVRLTAVVEVSVYSSAEPPPTEWRLVDNIGRLIVRLFHRKPRNLTIVGWKVIDIQVSSRGFPPHDVLAQAVGFTAILTIELAAHN